MRKIGSLDSDVLEEIGRVIREIGQTQVSQGGEDWNWSIFVGEKER